MLSKQEQILETLLFLENKAFSMNRLEEYLQVNHLELLDLLESYQKKLTKRGSLLKVAIRDNKIMLEPHHSILEEIATIYEGVHKKRFSDQSIEVLGIIAFKQPCTKQQIEKVRGVDSSYLIRNLMRDGFIKVIGKKESLGNPSLYGTTQEFLYYFGLQHIDELPSVEDLKTLYH